MSLIVTLQQRYRNVAPIIWGIPIGELRIYPLFSFHIKCHEGNLKIQGHEGIMPSQGLLLPETRIGYDFLYLEKCQEVNAIVRCFCFKKSRNSGTPGHSFQTD